MTKMHNLVDMDFLFKYISDHDTPFMTGKCNELLITYRKISSNIQIINYNINRKILVELLNKLLNLEIKALKKQM